MLREINPDISPTTAFRSLSLPSQSPPPNTSALDDIFGEPEPPSAHRATATTNSQLDDVFGSSPPSSAALERPTSTAAVHDVSDIPRLRSVHVTAGYRDGIAVSKAAHVQEGFDEGFPLGAVLGLRAGRVVGVLEGVVGALRAAANMEGQGQGQAKMLAATRHLLQRAREDLDVAVLFGPSYFDEEGIWRFPVEGQEEDITFEVVAARHPLVVQWEATVEQLAKDLDLDLYRLDRRAREDQSDGEQSVLVR